MLIVDSTKMASMFFLMRVIASFFGGANLILSVIPFHHPTRFFTLIAYGYIAVFFLTILLVVFTATAAVSHLR
jgi:hypothetical protein